MKDWLLCRLSYAFSLPPASERRWGGEEMPFGTEAAGHNFVNSQTHRDSIRFSHRPYKTHTDIFIGQCRRCGGRIQWSPAAQHRRLPAPPSTSRPGARGVPAHQQQRSWQLLARLLPGPRIQTIQEPLLPAQPSRSPRTWTWHETYASTLHSCSFRATHRPPEPGSKTRSGSASLSRQQFCCGSRDRENWDPVTGSRSLQESPFF